MNILDEELDQKIEAEAKEDLAQTLYVLAREYNRAVKEVARERQKSLGREFNYADFFMGASVIYKLTGDGGSLPFPAAAWAFQIIGNRNPAYDKDHPEPPAQNAWRKQWLVLDNYWPNTTLDSKESQVVTSYNDQWEAQMTVNALNERFNRTSRYALVQVPYPDYENEDYKAILGKLEEE